MTHICSIPRDSDRSHWWTCPDCGQVWRKADDKWRMTDRPTGEAS